MVFAVLDVARLTTDLVTHRAALLSSKFSRRKIVRYVWDLVDRAEAKHETRAIVSKAIRYFKELDGAGSVGGARFLASVMLALNLPGIGKTRMLYELLKELEVQLRAQFPDDVVDVVDLIFTFNQSIDNDVVVGTEAISIDALLGWRALRHHFAPNVSVKEFYRMLVVVLTTCRPCLCSQVCNCGPHRFVQVCSCRHEGVDAVGVCCGNHCGCCHRQ